MNDAAEELLGWSRDELRGRVMHDLAHYSRPTAPRPRSGRS